MCEKQGKSGAVVVVKMLGLEFLGYGVGVKG